MTEDEMEAELYFQLTGEEFRRDGEDGEESSPETVGLPDDLEDKPKKEKKVKAKKGKAKKAKQKKAKLDYAQKRKEFIDNYKPGLLDIASFVFLMLSGFGLLYKFTHGGF